MAFQKTIRYSLIAGTLWSLLAAGLGLWNEVQLLLLGPGADAVSGFGLIRPAYTTALFFGAGLSLFFGAATYCVQKAENRAFRHEAVGLAAFGSLQVGVLLGVVTILGGTNKGREFGEMSFVSDNLVVLALVLFLVSISLGAMERNESGYSPTFIGVLVSTAAFATSFFLGNVSLPHGPLLSAPLFSGLQDATVQEFYRFAILGFGVIGAVLSLAYQFVPEYYGVPLYSRSMAGFQIFGTLATFPFAAGAALAHSAAPAVGQTLGIVALIAGSASVLAGALTVARTVTAAEHALRSDRVALFVRYGIAILIAWTVVRAVLSLRFLQSSFAYTSLNTLDMARDMQTYGMLILFGVTYLAVQRSAGRPVVRLLTGWHLGLAVIGSVLLLLGDIAIGIPQALASQAAEQGKLVHAAWIDVLYAGSLSAGGTGKPDFALQYISSGRGLNLAGMGLLTLAALIAAANIVPTALRPGSGYETPNLKQAT